jgi:ABC-type tungstate transport system substrate-binding protein
LILEGRITEAKKMDYIIEGVVRALDLIFSLDKEIYGIVGRSVRFALTATLFATLGGAKWSWENDLAPYHGPHLKT